VRIHIVQLLVVQALACIPLDAQDTHAAAAAAKAAFVFGGAGYLHRWSMNDQHEFTPKGQEDLEKWSDMITINIYQRAHKRGVCRDFRPPRADMALKIPQPN
jgi:hypothetical protein